MKTLQAMHSERILIFEPETSKLRKGGVGAYGNAMVAIRRRYNNVLVDSDKQQQIEMFLGMKSGVYFPTAQVYYKVRSILPCCGDRAPWQTNRNTKSM